MQENRWANAQGIARRAGKASVFTDLFQIPAYAAEMVQVLRPDLNATEQDIQIVSLHSVLMVQPYNDLGLLVKNSLILCSEAQSTWSVNVLVRLFLYLAETYHRYIQQHEELNIYGTKKIPMPIPYCCLVYTGDGKCRPDMLSLAEEFWGKDAPLDLRVDVLSTPGTENIIQQYIRFCHVLNEQVKIHGRTGKAVAETIRICLSEMVLERYLEERAKEVQDIMMTLFSQEEATKRYGNECREEGREEGRKDGRREGRIESIKKMMGNLGLTADKAMDALEIPPQERAAYAAGLKL